MNSPQKNNSNSRLLDSLISKAPTHLDESESCMQNPSTLAPPVEIRERSIAAEILAESSRKRPEARITMTIHLPQLLAYKVESLAKKANLSRNEFVRLVIEKATT